MNIGELQKIVQSVSEELEFVSIAQCKKSENLLLRIFHKPSNTGKELSIVPWIDNRKMKDLISKECSGLITGTCEDKPKRRPRNTCDLETFATMETGDGPKFTLTRRPNLLVIEVDKKIVFRLNNREAENFRKIVNTLGDIQMGVGQIK